MSDTNADIRKVVTATNQSELVAATNQSELVAATNQSELVAATRKDNRKGDRHKIRFSVMVTATTESRLDELSNQYGIGIAALIRYCIDRQLPELEARLKTNPASAD